MKENLEKNDILLIYHHELIYPKIDDHHYKCFGIIKAYELYE